MVLVEFHEEEDEDSDLYCHLNVVYRLGVCCFSLFPISLTSWVEWVLVQLVGVPYLVNDVWAVCVWEEAAFFLEVVNLAAFQFDFCAAFYAVAMGAVVDDENVNLVALCLASRLIPDWAMAFLVRWREVFD